MPADSEAAGGAANVGLMEIRHQAQASAGPRDGYSIKGVLTLAAHEHKLDDGEQFLEIDGLADDFLGMQRPGLLK